MSYYDQREHRKLLNAIANLNTAKFNSLSNKEKDEQVLLDCAYCMIYEKPTKASLNKIGFRYRELLRKANGDVPSHVVDNILKADVRYLPVVLESKYKMTTPQLFFVAKNSPWQVFLWQDSFPDKLLNKVFPDYTKKLDLLSGLGLTEKQFDEQFQKIVHDQKKPAPSLPQDVSFNIR